MLTILRAGYYLHGTSALPHADTAVSDFTQLLADEEANVTSRRGLLPDSDLQVTHTCLKLQS